MLARLSCGTAVIDFTCIETVTRPKSNRPISTSTAASPRFGNTDLTAQSLAVAEYATKALVAAEQHRVKRKVVDGFSLDEGERAFAAEFSGLSASPEKKLAKEGGTPTVADTASLVMALAESLLEGEPRQRLKVLHIVKKLTVCLQANVAHAVPTTTRRSKASASTTPGQ